MVKEHYNHLQLHGLITIQRFLFVEMFVYLKFTDVLIQNHLIIMKMQIQKMVHVLLK